VLRAAARHGVAVPAVEEDLLGGTLDRDARRCAVRNAHQVHGAIGTTREHVLHRVTIPILAWTNDFGSVAEWDALIEQTARDAGDAGPWELVSGTSAATGAPS
jgi:acyl-CoA dehydrogenase